MPDRSADTCAALNASVLIAAPPVENRSADKRTSHRAAGVVTGAPRGIFALCLPDRRGPRRAYPSAVGWFWRPVEAVIGWRLRSPLASEAPQIEEACCHDDTPSLLPIRYRGSCAARPCRFVQWWPWWARC